MLGKDYGHMKDVFRPSHADYTHQMKYGIRNWKGGGQPALARPSVESQPAPSQSNASGRVRHQIVGFVRQVHQLSTDVDGCAVTMEAVEANPVRCRSPLAEEMETAIVVARKAGDSLGGIAEVVVHGAPSGWGEPVFVSSRPTLGRCSPSALRGSRLARFRRRRNDRQ